MSEPGESTPRRALPPREDDATPSAAESGPAGGGRRFSSEDRLAATLATALAELKQPSKRSPAKDAPELDASDPGLAAESASESAAIGTEADADEAKPTAGVTPPSQTSTLRRRWRIVALVLLVVVAGTGIGFGVWYSQRQPPPGASTVDPTVDPIVEYLLQPADLAGLREETTWAITSTDTAVQAETPQAKCLLPSADNTLAPQSSLIRTFSPESEPAGGLLHQVDLYADAEAATTAYQEQVNQLASCQKQTALLQGAANVGGVSDQAIGFRLVLQDSENEYHTFLLSRTGTRVNILDVTQPAEPIALEPVAGTLEKVSARQCADGGTCPTELAVENVPPPGVAPVGWLAAVDLPRLNPGSGAWRATEPSQIKSLGSRCEAVDLAALDKQESATQRTYLLAEDASIPSGFGVDEVVYTFANEDDAAAAAETLSKNLKACADRVPTAAVKQIAKFADTGITWRVTQQTDADETTVDFRVSVVRSGSRLVYLMANPTDGVDFSDDAWVAVSERAAQRAAQA